MLTGEFTGDMWHCAAASALASFGGDPTVIEPYPVTVIGIVEYGWDKSKTTVDVHNSFKRAGATFDYFRLIGIPILLARLSLQNGREIPGALLNLEPDYLSKITEVYVKNPKANFHDTWKVTEQAPTWTGGYKLVPASEIKASFPQIDEKVLFPAKPSASTVDFEEPEYTWEAPKVWKANSKLQLMTSTSIVMHYLSPADKRIDRINVLRKYLGGDVSDKNKEAYMIAAKQKIEELKALTVKAGWKSGDGQSIILFNYRKGDVNHQHDANVDLWNHVNTLASGATHRKTVLAIVLGFDNQSPPAAITRDNAITLYPPGFVDKRYTAAFWNLVATSLSDRIFGLIGGRSGSVDIAAFMGVNTCSWDEKLFPWGNPKGNTYRGLPSQQRQYLRLWNQSAIMSIVHLDERSYDRPTVYRRLDETQTLAWMNNGGATTPPPPLPVDVSIICILIVQFCANFSYS